VRTGPSATPWTPDKEKYLRAGSPKRVYSAVLLVAKTEILEKHMKSRPDGNFDVDANEQIQVTIVKSMPNCAAALSLSGATLSCQPSQFPVCKQCSFTAPATPTSSVTLTMSLDFQSDEQGNFADGDMYIIKFTGGPGSNVRPIHVEPPPALGLFFVFFVH